MTERFYVITGGPGSGKTTLVQALAEAGLHIMPEAGRAVIQEQRAIGGTALPWQDRYAFARAMLERDLVAYRAAEAISGPVIFDRGIPDIIGYLNVESLAVPQDIAEKARLHRYASTIFVAPFWPEIYANDRERRQDAATAEATFRAMVETYGALGYRTERLPLASLAERVRFVEQHIQT